jgi:hypothetical protein
MSEPTSDKEKAFAELILKLIASARKTANQKLN